VGRANQENAIRQRLVANVIGEPGLRDLTKQGGAAAFCLGLLSEPMKAFFSRENKLMKMKLQLMSAGKRLVELFDRPRGSSKLDLIRFLAGRPLSCVSCDYPPFPSSCPQTFALRLYSRLLQILHNTALRDALPSIEKECFIRVCVSVNPQFRKKPLYRR
jgi:hypothetical protein